MARRKRKQKAAAAAAAAAAGAAANSSGTPTSPILTDTIGSRIAERRRLREIELRQQQQKSPTSKRNRSPTAISPQNNMVNHPIVLDDDDDDDDNMDVASSDSSNVQVVGVKAALSTSLEKIPGGPPPAGRFVSKNGLEKGPGGPPPKFMLVSKAPIATKGPGGPPPKFRFVSKPPSKTVDGLEQPAPAMHGSDVTFTTKPPSATSHDSTVVFATKAPPPINDSAVNFATKVVPPTAAAHDSAVVVATKNVDTAKQQGDADGNKRKPVVVATHNPLPPKRRKLNDSTGIHDPNTSNGDNAAAAATRNTKTSKEIIELEEEILILEATMDTLVNRKKQLETEIDSIREKLQAAKTRVQGNEQQRAVLEAALEQHKRLQQDSEATLAKIVERLNRVLAGDDEQLGAGDDLMADADVTTTTTTTPIAMDTEPTVAGEISAITKVGQGSNEIIDLVDSSTESSPSTAEMNDAAPEFEFLTTLMQPKVKDFWNAKRDDLSLMTFLPCLSTADTIRKVMDVRAMEAWTWDGVTPANGRYRLESLWNTCVDYCLMGHIRLSTDANGAPTAKATPTPVIDPDVALCPHELGGECLNLSCTFQHIRPHRTTKPPKNRRKITGASSQPLEGKEQQQAIPDSAAHQTPAVDPNVALCPYELTGVCADSLCPYQHLNPRPEVPILPRELLPMPPLKLPPQVGSIVTTEKRGAIQRGGKAKRPELDETKTSVADPAKTSKPSADPVIGNEDFVGNDDFVTIPVVANSDESEGESETEEGLEDWHSRVRHANEAPRGFWWMDSGIAQSAPQNSTFGLIECLQFIGKFWLESEGKRKVISYRGKRMTNLLEVIKFVGSVVDCARLSIHAGRFDIGKALVTHGINVIRILIKCRDKPDVVPSHTSTCLLDTLEVVKEAGDAAFLYDAHQQNPLIAAFESGALLAILSTLVQSFHDHLSKPAKATRRQEHHASMTGLLGRIREAINVKTKILNLHDSPLEGKKAILDHCLALFNPQPVSLPKQQPGMEDGRDGDFLEVRLLLATFVLSRSLYINLASSSDFALHRQEILEKFWKEAKMQLRSSGSAVLQSAIAVGSVLFGCIGNVVYSIPDKQNIDPSTVASLTTFDRTLYHVVSCLRDDYLKFLFGGILVAPLIAAATSLAVLLRNYPKAQHRLEEAMTAKCHIGQTRLGILALSELLWSQLTILKSSLPVDSGEAISLQSMGSLSDGHNKLAQLVVSYGLHLNHVTLDGDWNLLPINAVKNAQRASNIIISGLAAKSAVYPADIRLVEMNPLGLRDTFHRETTCISTFPQGLFLVGQTVQRLQLTRCRLPNLPLSFGYHFPKLTTLNLTGCGLEELPDSISALVRLEVLNLDTNQLERIPDWIGICTKLRTLNVNRNEVKSIPPTVAKLTELADFRAEHNHLTEISQSLLACKNLGVLHVTNNHLPYTVTPSLLTQHFPKLHDLKVQPQRPGGQPQRSAGDSFYTYQPQRSEGENFYLQAMMSTEGENDGAKKEKQNGKGGKKKAAEAKSGKKPT